MDLANKCSKRFAEPTQKTLASLPMNTPAEAPFVLVIWQEGNKQQGGLNDSTPLYLPDLSQGFPYRTWETRAERSDEAEDFSQRGTRATQGGREEDSPPLTPMSHLLWPLHHANTNGLQELLPWLGALGSGSN